MAKYWISIAEFHEFEADSDEEVKEKILECIRDIKGLVVNSDEQLGYSFQLLNDNLSYVNKEISDG